MSSGDVPPGPPPGWTPDPYYAATKRFQADMTRHLAARDQRQAAWTERLSVAAEGGARLIALDRALRQARQGTLAPDWRAHLRAEDIAPGMLDISQSAVDALRATPVAPWEPWAACGDWRRALESWLAASIGLLDERDRGNARWRATDPDPTWRAPTIEAVDANALRETERRERSRRERDALTASFLAGLAAGGDPVDWQAWFYARTGATKNQPPGYPAVTEDLPRYWTEQTS